MARIAWVEDEWLHGLGPLRRSWGSEPWYGSGPIAQNRDLWWRRRPNCGTARALSGVEVAAGAARSREDGV